MTSRTKRAGRLAAMKRAALAHERRLLATGLKTSPKQLFVDLSEAYCRLDHLLYIHLNPESIPAAFGPNEVMMAARQWIKEVRARYGFKPTWPEPRDFS